MAKRSPGLEALRELCELGLHAEVLVPAVLEALHATVPSARNLFDWTDEQGRLVRYFVEGPVDEAIAQLYFDEFHNRREAEVMPAFDLLRMRPAGVRGADDVDQPSFRASALYQAIWRPQGLHTRLEGVLRGRRGQLLGSLVLYRGPGEARYTAEDERRLAAVLPMLAGALEACGPARIDDHHVPGPEPAQTLLLSLDGELLQASDGAMRLLLLADGGLSRSSLSHPPVQLAGRLLHVLLMRLREQVARAGGMGLAPPPSIVHDSPFGRYSATAMLLRPRAAGEPPLVLVTLEHLEPHRVALARALRALPLTPGQRRVCHALYRGATQAEVAAELGVAPATVVDHVRKLYRTLGVASTLQLRACIDAAVGHAPPPLGGDRSSG
ncbi:MAG: helix-turn-helix transcriptional regulator [Rubrivivax sp.]|nr:helix-turn-helix transcriptional regulator [Rubrivivax sp.]